jgi:hypothetical protein
MRSKYINFIWGLVLILGGGLFLASNLGFLEDRSPQLWMAIFASASLLFFAGYFLNGVREWGWLFPASIFGSLALTIELSELGLQGSVVAAPILVSVALPFAVAFVLEPRQRWWALIPAWVMVVLTALILFVERLPGEAIAALILFSIALPFLVVYLVDRSRRWALIPAFVLAAVGTIPLLAIRLSGELMGSVVLMLIALPFFVVYFMSEENWWALIPAGILSSIALSLALVFVGQFEPQETSIMVGVMFLGWSATFVLLWLGRTSQPTDWARYPALGLLAAGVLALVSRAGFQMFLPLVIIALGFLILIMNLWPKRVG